MCGPMRGRCKTGGALIGRAGWLFMWAVQGQEGVGQTEVVKGTAEQRLVVEIWTLAGASLGLSLPICKVWGLDPSLRSSYLWFKLSNTWVRWGFRSDYIGEREGRKAGESDTDTKGTLGRVGLSGLLGQRAGPRFRPSVIQLWDLGQVTQNPKGSSFVFIVWEW